MIRRLIAFILMGWLLGFAWFAILLPQPLSPKQRTDAIVVLTGGAGRIGRGLELLRSSAAKDMLISGVDRDVRPVELALAYDVPEVMFDCCITLGHEAVDTRSNAIETAHWIERRKYRSVRLITTDWHMRRAHFELEQALPPGIAIHIDAVHSNPSLKILFKEYNKYLLRRAAALLGI
ncbi:MAG: YdcF family protein [Alphaproteobacteria bacterium]|nr:YdcF family protein [Alphaproteobacteria bacterium]